MMHLAADLESSTSTQVLFLLATVLFGTAPTLAQPTFTSGVLPNGVPDGATGSDIISEPPDFFDPANGDYRPDKPAGSPLVNLAGEDAPRDGRLLNGQTQTAGGWDAGALESNGAALPVELADLSATADNEAVRLTWQTASERNNTGFRIQRQDGGPSAPSSSEWTMIGRVDGAGTTTRAQSYQFVDETPPFAAERLRYRLVQVDMGGATTASDPVVVERSSPTRARLRPPSPNPARSEVTVRLALPERPSTTNAHLAVFDVLGRQVTTRSLDARGGERRTIQLTVSDWPSGLYFVRLQAGGTTRTERLTVVR